ncbi:MAG: hypothetical protein GY723_02875 [bacterium]|nr:hypothetical protein [bacterium]
MPLRHPFALIALAAVACLGLACPPQPQQIITPAHSSVVGTSSFPVEVHVTGANLDVSATTATLNGVALPLTEGPAGTFTATVDPGDPLLDSNELAVTTPLLGGGARMAISQFDYLPPKARAFEITDSGDLLTGPMAHNQLGDYLIENDVARFVIQAPGQRDLHSVGQFGGNLIDAELVSKPGLDQFFEIQPSINLETVINAQTIEVVNDGQNGETAILRTCGPDDLADYINASSQVEVELGLSLPNVMSIVDDRDYDVTGCTEYRLEPGKKYVAMETTVYNNDASDVKFYAGYYVNGMGSLEQWIRSGSNPLGLGEPLVTSATEILGFMGFGDAEGVDYGLVPIGFAGGLPSSSSFTTSGVSFLLHSHSLLTVLGIDWDPFFNVPGGGSHSFLSYFSVGDGSLANSAAVEAEVKGLSAGTLSGCVTADGSPAPSARVAAGPIVSGAISRVDAHFVTDASGCYQADLPSGTYGVAASKEGHLFEGAGSTPIVHSVTVPAAGAVIAPTIDLPATGRIRIEAVDETSSPVPARIVSVGIDPSPEPTLTYILTGIATVNSGTFNDLKESPERGLTSVNFAGASGIVEFDLEPGDYQITVSRGTEWSIHQQDVTAVAGSTVTVNAQIAPVLDTTGFVSSDYHVHMLYSPDSRIGLVDRALSYSGEGVDNIIVTDHDAVTDLTPTIASLGLTPFVHATIGEEITTFDYGHYNAYPQGQDTSLPSNGSTDWGGAAPPGEDFPSLGHYGLSPAEIEAEVLSDPSNAGLDTVVHINHIDSHFGPLQIDTALEPPQSLLPDPSIFRLDPTVTNFFHDFLALELWNGASVGAQNSFLDKRIGVWMNLLNQGIPSTAIADSDTHTVKDLESAGGRTWTPSSTDSPAGISDSEIGLAVQSQRAVGGQGCYLQTQLVEGAAVADFSLGGDTLVTATDGSVDLEIHLQAPVWAEYDTIEIYRNAETVVAGTSGGTPVAYSANPTSTLTLGGGDFVRNTLNIHAGVSGADRFDTALTVPLTGLTVDEWVVVVARGTVGNSTPAFPVYPYNADSGQTLAQLKTLDASEGGVRALCYTNALFVDVDGNGSFDEPGVQLAGP